MIWWFILYWPIIGGLLLLGNLAEKRYAPDTKLRHRTDLALGCALIAMPSVPLVIAIGAIIFRNQNDPIVRTFEGFFLFWICLATFYGALAKFSFARRAVSLLQNRITTLLTLK